MKQIESEYSRRQIRSLIFHFLYAMEAFDYQESLAFLIDQFNNGFELALVHDGEVASTTLKIVARRQEFDTLMQPLFSHWRIDRIGMCTRLILYLAIWELLETETHPTIIINEAIELSKCFSEKDAYKFINGILDELSLKLGRRESVS